jgi:hypothetical protein
MNTAAQCAIYWDGVRPELRVRSMRMNTAAQCAIYWDYQYAESARAARRLLNGGLDAILFENAVTKFETTHECL